MAITGSLKAEAKLFAQFQGGDMIEIGVLEIDIPISVAAEDTEE